VTTYDGAQMTGQTQDVIPDLLHGIVIFLYVLAIIAIFVTTFVVVLLRFYKNLLGDEGYLMMTLPVSREQHILSKLSAAMIWFVCSAVLVVLSVILLITTTGDVNIIAEAFKELTRAGVPVGLYILLIIVLLIVGCANGILMLYAAMAIGPNLLKNRIGGSILAYIIICVISQIIYFCITIGVFSSVFRSGFLINMAGTDAATTISIINSMLISSIVYCVVISVGCGFVTRFMLKRKLNLA
jgi:hypothetical protein